MAEKVLLSRFGFRVFIPPERDGKSFYGYAARCAEGL